MVFFMESLLPQLQALSESANHTSSLSRSRDAQNVSLAKSRHGISALNETDHTIYRIFHEQTKRFAHPGFQPPTAPNIFGFGSASNYGSHLVNFGFRNRMRTYLQG